MSDLIRSLDRHARARPEALAVRDVDGSGSARSLTWRQLRDVASLHAARLRRRPTPGAVMISAPSRIETVVAILGGLWADAAVLPVSPEMLPAELLDLAGRASVTTVVGDAPGFEALSGLGVERIQIGSLEPDGCTEPTEPGAGGGGSILLQSSGTTGAPKIVRRRAAALDAVGEGSRRAIGVHASDAVLLCIPLCHSYGIDQGVLTTVISGCAVELHERFQPAQARAALAAGEITILPAVPLMFDALARTAGEAAPAHALRRAISAGSPLPPRVFDEFLRVFGVKIGQLYGSTEFGSVTYNDPDEAAFDPKTVGRPMSGVEIRIVDTAEPRVDRPLPTGVEGQVALASPTMLSEYVDDPEPPTADGFILTGDLGRLDEHGCLRLTGRVKLLIDVGGRKVNPLEVESVLTEHEAVSSAVVVAMPFSDTADRLKAIVVPEPGHQLDGEELRCFARARLSPYKIPRSFEIRADLPRSTAGKILRNELQGLGGG